jgi:hypothetical protein
MMIDECCFRVLGRRLSLPWNREHKGMAREYSVGRWGDLLGMLMCKFDKTLYPPWKGYNDNDLWVSCNTYPVLLSMLNEV